MQNNIIALVLNTGIVIQLTMLVLVFFSVMSWAITILKYFQLRSVERENALFYRAFEGSRDMESLFSASRKFINSTLAGMFRSAMGSASRESLLHAMKKQESIEAIKIEKNLSFLATCGSVTPLIGLFGTVWGIMHSFMNIGQAGGASLIIVAPGIAEALITTAMGLIAAIPAVILHNYFVSRTGIIIVEMEDFSGDVLDALETREG